MTKYYKEIKQTRIWGKGRPAVIFFQREFVEVFDDYAEVNYRTLEGTDNYRIRVAHSYRRKSDDLDAFDSKVLTKEFVQEIMKKASKGKDGITYESLLNDLLDKGLVSKEW